MDTVYFKHYGIWLGGAIVLDWLLAYSGLLNFIYYEFGPQFFGWILIIAGTIAGTAATHKALGKNIEFGKAILPVMVIIGGFNLIQFVFFFGGEFGYFLYYFINFTLIDLALGVVVLLTAGSWYMFVKAGKPGWAYLIPIYNLVVMCEIAKKPGYWVLLFLVPVLNIVLLIIMLNGISRNFGKDTGFTVGLFFLRPIFMALLGYGDAAYHGQPNPIKTNDQIVDDLR